VGRRTTRRRWYTPHRSGIYQLLVLEVYTLEILGRGNQPQGWEIHSLNKSLHMHKHWYTNIYIEAILGVSLAKLLVTVNVM
jgi:hypothetical protein